MLELTNETIARLLRGLTFAVGKRVGPSCVSPAPAAPTRIVWMARIRLHSRKSLRSFKEIICIDICEFESSHPSHAVRSLWRFCRGPSCAAGSIEVEGRG